MSTGLIATRFLSGSRVFRICVILIPIEIDYVTKNLVQRKNLLPSSKSV